ncbi:MAG: hypothetical protein JHC93_08325, partial [Parachlamydiales bacterium]|nr:hypothetical protein [Parachlamydiales bacterium]
MGINPKDYNDKLAHIEKSLGKDDVDLEAIKSDFKTKLGLDIAGMRFKQAIVKTDGNTVNYWYPVTNSDVKFSNKKDKETLLKKARFLLGVSQVYEKAIAAQTAPHLPKDSESQLTFYKNRKTDFEYLNPPASKVSVESNAWNGDVQEVFFKIIGFGGNYNPKPDNSKSDLGKKTDSAKPATDINPTVPKNPSASTDLAKGKDPVTKTETAPATSSRGVKPASEPTKPLKSSDLGVTGTKPTPEAEIKTETESAISASGVKPASEPIIPPKSDHTGEISEDTTTKTSKDVELTPAEPTSENKTKPIIITKPSNLGATRTNPKPEADKKTEPAKITGKDDSATSIKTAVGTEIKPLNNPSAISTDSETKIEKKIEPTTISEDKPVSNPQISPKPILESASETDVEAKDLDDLDKDLEDLSKLFPHDVKTGASEIKQNPADELSSTPPKNPTASSIDSETKIEKKIEQTKVESTPPPKNPKSGNSFFSGVKSLFGSFGNSSNNKKDSSATT